MKGNYYTVVSYWPQTSGAVYRTELTSVYGAPILFKTKKEAVKRMKDQEAQGAICHLGFAYIDYPKAPKRSDFA